MKQTGFSLIELLVTLAVLGILAGFSYPLYTHHIAKAHRQAAEAELLYLAQGMERYYLQHHSYQGATLDLTNDRQEDAYYHFEIAQVSDTAFELQAIPQTTQADIDQACGTLTLNEQGAKGVTGLGRVDECW